MTQERDVYSAQDAETPKGIIPSSVQQGKLCVISAKLKDTVRVYKTKKKLEVNVAAVSEVNDEDIAFLGSVSENTDHG